MDENGLTRQLVEGTLDDLREVIGRLEGQRAEISQKLEETRKRCLQWETQLKRFDSNGQRRTRAKKGENEEKIAEAFRENPGQGFTLPQLVERTGISWSSVRNVILRKQSDKYQAIDGMYFEISAIAHPL